MDCEEKLVESVVRVAGDEEKKRVCFGDVENGGEQAQRQQIKRHRKWEGRA